ncbi:izumo sperm-egg fusion protein 2 isoform X1 [Erinaceus europaeus]|uniref:Izumo sperm-egg fusion protein 2 isoform X1 n=1 Tax=Erinaceus europaeus TaxID=9365 RepID=A0ABM3W289_ERIEU|nr:izumo sperm-egg fusion protein 2 isoform X1 [Erinaceus europaeus]
MPAALALLLLLALGARGARGCLQCDPSVRQALGELRAALSPKRIHLERLQARAQALLLAMEGPFFRDYAVNAFLGKVDLNDLELVASFTKNQTTQLRQGPLTDMPLLDELVTLRERVVKELKKVLKSYELKACDPKVCRESWVYDLALPPTPLYLAPPNQAQLPYFHWVVPLLPQLACCLMISDIYGVVRIVIACLYIWGLEGEKKSSPQNALGGSNPIPTANTKAQGWGGGGP